LAWKQYWLTGDRIDYIRATTEKNEFTTLTRNLCRDFEWKWRQPEEKPKRWQVLTKKQHRPSGLQKQSDFFKQLIFLNDNIF